MPANLTVVRSSPGRKRWRRGRERSAGLIPLSVSCGHGVRFTFRIPKRRELKALGSDTVRQDASCDAKRRSRR